MPFVLPLNDQDAENARLLDRLTKQQEENQSLRAENAKLKAENQSLRLENDQKLDWATTADAKADKLESELAEHKRIAEKRAEDMRKLRAEINSSEKHWKDMAEKYEGEGDWRWAEVDFYIQRQKAEVEKLKAELLDINAKHHRDTQKTCLKEKFGTWREEQVKYNSGYSLEDEAEWLVYEAINIHDAIEVFNETYDDGIGDDYTWRLECDHLRNWNIIQLYMDDEGEYTLTEEEFEAQNK